MEKYWSIQHCKTLFFGGHKKKNYFEPILFNLLKQQTQQEHERKEESICVHAKEKRQEGWEAKKVTKQNCKNSIIKEKEKNHKKKV